MNFWDRVRVCTYLIIYEFLCSTTKRNKKKQKGRNGEVKRASHLFFTHAKRKTSFQTQGKFLMNTDYTSTVCYKFFQLVLHTSLYELGVVC